MRELPRVKVCGLTHPVDVILAAGAGADALGFVHHPPSPRSVPAARLAELAAGVPAGVLRVLVLVDAQPAQALALAREGAFDAVQLCGAERASQWRDFPLPLLRRVAASESGARELQAWLTVAAGFVIDHPSGPGGSGRGVDLEHAARLCAAAPCLLAGGLDAASVAESIARARPAGVDAASRLESVPGRKDPRATRTFVRAALRALQRSDSSPDRSQP